MADATPPTLVELQKQPPEFWKDMRELYDPQRTYSESIMKRWCYIFDIHINKKKLSIEQMQKMITKSKICKY